MHAEPKVGMHAHVIGFTVPCPTPYRPRRLDSDPAGGRDDTGQAQRIGEGLGTRGNEVDYPASSGSVPHFGQRRRRRM